MIDRYVLRRALLSMGLVLVLFACSEESLEEFFVGYTPHQRYERRLEETGLDQTALGSDWIAASATAVARAAMVTAPYREESYLDPREAAASAYRISLKRGQRLAVTFESSPDSSYQVFLDLFRIGHDSVPRLLTSADSSERSLEYLVRRDSDYVLRVQPELLRGGGYAVTILVGPSLTFPVSGHDTTAIRSWYGDPRDGGRRRHEGLDIFAPRGTPVLAAADGVIRSTRPNNLGGNVVWLRDRDGRTHYYAHLDRQSVQRGDRVTTGDTIGYVGNSGNARTTPPHLHFGVYARGSFDPYPALYQPPASPPDFTGDTALIGQTVRAAREGARVRSLPDAASPIVAELPIHAPVRVLAGSGGWLRVELPDRTSGFVAVALTETISAPIERQVMASDETLLTALDSSAAALERIGAGTEVAVLGSYGDHLFVQGPSGRSGWLIPSRGRTPLSRSPLAGGGSVGPGR
jgi:murein DD-endopeptidase MepM/ murein hydrolase activator NlpD